MEDAAIMAGRLKQHGFVPQKLVASSALRTESTANIFAEHLSLHPPQTDKAIYDGDYKNIVNIINAFGDEHDAIGLVGHNPDMSNLLYYLTGEPRDVPTCAVMVIKFELDEWKLITENTGTLLWYGTPNEE